MCTDKAEYGDDGTFGLPTAALEYRFPRRTSCPRSLSRPRDRVGEAYRYPAHVGCASFSTMVGSAKGEVPTKVQRRPSLPTREGLELAVDGDRKLDAAPAVRRRAEGPGPDVAGKANVLVFPDLEAGNIGYKLVQRFAGAQAYGPDPTGHREAGERPSRDAAPQTTYRHGRGHHRGPGPDGRVASCNSGPRAPWCARKRRGTTCCDGAPLLVDGPACERTADVCLRHVRAASRHRSRAPRRGASSAWRIHSVGIIQQLLVRAQELSGTLAQRLLAKVLP